MKKYFGKAASTAICALAMTATLGVSEASAAKYLFDFLFGNHRQKVQEAAPQPQQQPQPRKVVKAPRVSAPTYYNYKVDSLVKVDFSAIPDVSTGRAYSSHVEEPGFAEALPALSDFDLRAEKDVAEAIQTHYAANPEFIWVTGLRPNVRAEQALKILGDADSYGLVSNEYSTPVPSAMSATEDRAARLRAMARFEMTLSARVLRYMEDAHGGRVVADRLSGYHDLPQKTLDLAQALNRLGRTYDVAEYLEARHPQNRQYRQLRAELEMLRASQENEIVVDPDTFVRPGGNAPDFPKLLKIIDRDADDAFKAEFGEVLARHMNSDTYDEELTPVIKAAQKAAGLKDDGIIGPRTVRGLAGVSKADKIDKVLVALEELRWLPSDFGDTYVFINQPEFRARFIKNGDEKLSMRVVVGRPSNQTTFFYDKIETVDYNPYWGVPRSIIVNEMLPRLLNDPGYLDRAGYEVTDSKGRHIPSSSIDWGRYGANIPFDVRQTPGEANALGELKILFPNKHAIYMHDTPSKSFFQRDMRALSHGCVRLQEPREMAAAVLQTSVEDVAQKLKQGHSSQAVPVQIPVYVSYFTAWPDQSGSIIYSADVYDRDSHTLTAMHKVAEQRGASS